MNMKDTFFYVNLQKHVDNQSLLLFGRQLLDKEVYNFFIDDFFPFFAVALNDTNMKTILRLESERVILKHEPFYNDDPEHPYRDLYKKPLLVLYVSNTKMIDDARHQFKETFQADVIYERAFRISKNIYGFFNIQGLKDVLKRTPIFLSVTKNETIMKSDIPFYKVSHFNIRGF